MKLEFEYGHGLMSAELPDNTDVFIPGTTVPDPPCLPQDWDSLYNATLQRGDPVLMNKYVFDCDIPILIGHTQGNPYGGYSGGYKHCSTGITHWRSIASHHVPKVMHRSDFTPVSGHSLMRTKFDEIGMLMEEKMGYPFFCCDAVLDTYSRQIAIFSGYAKVMQPESWKVANKRTYVPYAEKKYDVMVFGMPQNFHYGNGMGTNPIRMMQALSAQVIRHKRVMKDNCVIICSSICNGFSMMSCGHIAEMNTSAIYIVGAQEPITLRLAYMPNWGALWAAATADTKGYFEEEGITVLEELEGKTIGYSAGTSSEAILTTALESVGLTMEDVNAMSMDSTALTTAAF